MHVPTDYHDVIIAGAGPVGLFLACELGSAGCSVLVLEQTNKPHTPLKGAPFGLRGLSVPTVESFDRRDLLTPLKARIPDRQIAAAAPWMKQARRPGGHFAGIDFFLDRIDQAQWLYRLAHSAEPMASDLESIEAVLTHRAEALGVTIRRGFGVSDVDVTDNDVTVQANGKTFRGSWLVGCDGGRSTVRKTAGFAFAGTEPEFTGYFAQIELADPAMLEPGHHDTPGGTYIFDPPDMIRMVEFDGGACHRIQPVTRDHIQAVLRRISGTRVEVKALGRATTWTDRAYLAADYRKGRVLLAGDAAHVHSPLGGQGLNLGLGDAMNLGWKLAATIRSDAAELLDSYQRERRPVAEQILDWSRAQVTLMRPSPSSQALRAIVRDLATTRDGTTYFAERVWGVGIRYDIGESHPLVGRSVPDFTFENGSRVNEYLRTGHGVLLDFSGEAALQTLAGGWRDRIDCVAAKVVETLGVVAALVRPDGVVAWACEKAPDLTEVEATATRWFGAPMRVGFRPR